MFHKKEPTSSSLCRVLDVKAEVIPAFLEFWTNDWIKKKTLSLHDLNVMFLAI